jgi:hypothetical protein
MSGNTFCADQIIKECRADNDDSVKLACRDEIVKSLRKVSRKRSDSLSKEITNNLTIEISKRVVPRFNPKKTCYEENLANIALLEERDKWFSVFGDLEGPEKALQEDRIVFTMSDERIRLCPANEPKDPAARLRTGLVGEANKGIAYRVPALAHLSITNQNIMAGPEAEPLVDEKVVVPQLGDVLLLPIDIKRFESKTVSVEFSEVGVPQSFKYISKADAKRISGSLLDSAKSVGSYKTVKKQNQLSELTFEKQLLDSQKTLAESRKALLKAERELEEEREKK